MTVKTQHFYYKLLLQGWMFRLLNSHYQDLQWTDPRLSNS